MTNASSKVFVLVGFYSDRSGCQLLGVFSDVKDAESTKDIADAAGCAQQLRIVAMPVDEANPQMVF